MCPMMDYLHRRGVLAALLCSPAFLLAERTEQVAVVRLPQDFILKVTCRDKTIVLSAQDIVNALESSTDRLTLRPL